MPDVWRTFDMRSSSLEQTEHRRTPKASSHFADQVMLPQPSQPRVSAMALLTPGLVTQAVF